MAKKLNISRQEILKIVRFALVGVIATAIYIGISFMLLNCDWNPRLVNLIAFISSTLASYFGHYFFTYRAQDSHWRLGAKFILATAILTAICGIFHAVILAFGVSPAWAVIVVSMTYPPISFALNHFWAFARGTSAEA